MNKRISYLLSSILTVTAGLGLLSGCGHRPEELDYTDHIKVTGLLSRTVGIPKDIEFTHAYISRSITRKSGNKTYVEAVYYDIDPAKLYIEAPTSVQKEKVTIATITIKLNHGVSEITLEKSRDFYRAKPEIKDWFKKASEDLKDNKSNITLKP